MSTAASCPALIKAPSFIHLLCDRFDRLVAQSQSGEGGKVGGREGGKGVEGMRG